MNQPSPDAKAVVRAVDALTTQVRRIADALTTPVVEDAEAETTAGEDAFRALMDVPAPAPITVHLPGQPPLVGTWHGGGAGTPRGSEELVWEPTITFPGLRFPGRRPPMDPVHILGAEAPAEHRGGNAEDCPACSGTNPPYPFICPGPAQAADEDALRATRRDSLLVLLSRAERGVLKPHEAEQLHLHVEAEIHESNTARSVARSNLRHVKILVPELEKGQGAIERVRRVADLIEAGAPWTANQPETARRIRAAIDAEPGTEH
ncbi:hypothetical protein [Streptomyces luteogriseus]|uniref:hypothetical protein n=1 Tax=Streptomyces luteogriseus TaxID=68233 RepID=UPI00381DE30D